MSAKKDRERRAAERLEAEVEAQGHDRRRRLLQLASAAVFLTVAAVLVLIVVSGNETSGGDAGNVQQARAVDHLLAGIPQRGMLLGEPQAKVRLVEFGDLQCPVCKAFSEEIVPSVIDNRVREGKASIEFRNFTIIGEESIPAGAAAIAAGEQGRGWNYVDLFYRNQGRERSGYVTDEFLTAIARGAGVRDIARWNRERKSKTVLAEVGKTTREAERLGFGGTPSFAVEGPVTTRLKALEFPESSGEIEEAIDAARG
ncbi:MAG: DsbA family protein [Solirubrobacterales bacterium]